VRSGKLAAALGPDQDAEELLAAALRQAADLERGAPGYTCLFLRTRADLRCARGQLDLAQADYEMALRHATDPRWRFVDYEGHVRRGLGGLASRRSCEQEANGHFAAALDLARRIGYQWLEAEIYVARARSVFRFGNPEQAEDWSERAYALAETGGWVALAGECFLIKAQCASRRSPAKTREYLELARSRIVRSGKRSLKDEYASICGETL
jgi:tetratricopeptide (TPR) repeat protein